VDASNNLYIADTHNNRIREVSGGIIATIAGTGAASFSGDGGPAAAAALDYPTALAIDSNGNLYIADTNNSRIREISAGLISTVAGNGQQTYSGDGGPAIAAGLDSPNGVAVDAAFNLYIGDTHNQRIRMVAAATGIITTLAGTGVKGYTGDGAAVSAALAAPHGVAVNSAGAVYIADSDNDRIRTVAGGQLTTVAGSGLEGFSGDTGASTQAQLDTPQSVAIYGGTVAFSDTQNQRVRTISSNGVDTVAGNTPTQNESLALSGATSIVYGTGTLTVSFSNGSNSASGPVSLYDGLGASPALVATATLSANSATFSTASLSAATHDLVAGYAGDAHNAAVTSGVYVLRVSPVQLTALANAVSLLYGQPIPPLTGTLSGVLAQDAGNVAANYATTATAVSDPATYPIAATLSGSASGNYTLVLGATSGAVVIAQAPSTIALTASNATPVFGAAVTLTATVASTTSGVPAGTVNFYDGGTLLNATPATVTGGVAALQLNTLPVGTNSVTAMYSGSTDFLGSSAAAVGITVLSPDFSIAASPSSQSLLPNSSAAYTITLTPANPTFVSPVSLSASGLPAGVTAVFSPSSIAAGSAAVTSTLTLTASSQARLQRSRRPSGGNGLRPILAWLLLPLAFTRRLRRGARQLSRAGGALLAVLTLAVLASLAACGGGGFFGHPVQNYTVTVTAVSGATTHTASVTLTLE
jgi:hypothetical protein